MRSGSGVSVTSMHSTDLRSQEEPEEEEKEADKKLPGQETSVKIHVVSDDKYTQVFNLHMVLKDFVLYG